jgi:hypothetical protein
VPPPFLPASVRPLVGLAFLNIQVILIEGNDTELRRDDEQQGD